jgi:hypothetical protein
MIKSALRLLILVFVLPATGFSHAEIFFPRLLSYSDLPNTGIALLNPDTTTANVSAYLVSAGGSAVASTMLQIAPGRQIARSASQLFPQARDGGWVYVFTDSEGMQGFWLTYDDGLTYLDGGEAAQYEKTGPDQILPLVAGDTELTVLCLSGIRSLVPVTVRLFGGDGTELAPAFVESLPSAGALHADVSELFPTADITKARYLRIETPGPPAVSSALIKRFLVPVEAAVVDGVNVSPQTELIFPHVVNGSITGANYTTIIGVINLSSSSQTVTITFHTVAGSSLVATRDVAGNGAFRETAQSLFGLSSEFQTGWVSVKGAAFIKGFAAYADSVRGGFTVVPDTVSQTNLFFMHIANGLPQWQTGLALLNASDNPAVVEMYAVDPSGTLIGRMTTTIDPGMKIAGVVHEFIPQTKGLNGGFIYLRSFNTPLYGIELFYTEDLKVLSNVAAGKLEAGVTYSPPSQ